MPAAVDVDAAHATSFMDGLCTPAQASSAADLLLQQLPPAVTSSSSGGAAPFLQSLSLSALDMLELQQNSPLSYMLSHDPLLVGASSDDAYTASDGQALGQLPFDAQQPPSNSQSDLFGP